MKKILLQGAMNIETEYFIEQVKLLPDYEFIKEDEMEYHQGRMDDKILIVQTTGMGTVKAAMATACALLKFHPTAVINQGTAGAQIRELSSGDLVLAEQAVNINALQTPKKKLGEGCDPFSWDGFHTCYYKADAMLLDFFKNQDKEYMYGKKIVGNAATGDMFSREDDRIIWLEEKYHTVCEDMESAAVYEVCEKFETPCVGVRVISNNELLDEPFNENVAKLLQEHLWKMLPHL